MVGVKQPQRVSKSYKVIKKFIDTLNEIQFEIIGEFAIIIGGIILGIYISQKDFALKLGIGLVVFGIIVRIMLGKEKEKEK